MVADTHNNLYYYVTFLPISVLKIECKYRVQSIIVSEIKRDRLLISKVINLLE